MTMITRILAASAFAALAGCAAALAPPSTGNPAKDTVFSIAAPEARVVCVVGSFNQWDRDRHRLSGPNREGRWTITIPLPSGRHEYLFLINEMTWILDPAAPVIDDGLGGRNSVLVVPPE